MDINARVRHLIGDQTIALLDLQDQIEKLTAQLAERDREIAELKSEASKPATA